MKEIGPDLGKGRWKYRSGVLADNGSIYCSPRSTKHFLKITPKEGGDAKVEVTTLSFKQIEWGLNEEHYDKPLAIQHRAANNQQAGWDVENRTGGAIILTCSGPPQDFSSWATLLVCEQQSWRRKRRRQSTFWSHPKGGYETCDKGNITWSTEREVDEESGFPAILYIEDFATSAIVLALTVSGHAIAGNPNQHQGTWNYVWLVDDEEAIKQSNQTEQAQTQEQ